MQSADEEAQRGALRQPYLFDPASFIRDCPPGRRVRHAHRFAKRCAWRTRQFQELNLLDQYVSSTTNLSFQWSQFEHTAIFQGFLSSDEAAIAAKSWMLREHHPPSAPIHEWRKPDNCRYVTQVPLS